MSKGREKKRLYIAAAVAAAAVVVIVLVTVLVLGGREETYRSIRIVELEGSVTIDRESVGSLNASVNMNLVSGDHVSTSAGAYVVLRLDEDKYVMLGEQGAMKVETDGDASKGRTAIHLEAGSVLSEIQKPLGQNATYEIVTPSATMSVRGTVFEVRRNRTDSDGNIEVLVYEGQVAVDIEGQEPVLYSGGEYTQFTAGDTPQFLEERSAIRPEQMNGQMLKRLQQIEESGRSLDFGEATLEELIGQKNSDSEPFVADNSQVQEPEGYGNSPEPETQDPATAEPSPDVTASEAPASTERPRSSAAPAPKTTPAPAPTPGPSATPTPAPKPGPTAAPASPAVTPKPPAATTPAPTTKPSVDPPTEPTQTPTTTWIDDPSAANAWKDASNKDKPTETEDGKKKWKVIFYMTGIVETMPDDIASLGVASPVVYMGQVQLLDNGSKITMPDEPTYNNIQGGGTDKFEFVGWYTETCDKWNFETEVTSNIYLFPVWENTVDGSMYYPVIRRDPDPQKCYCFSLKK
ncbi:MAG: FecR domain-containing protein [Acetatifactor sp.]|nr:FecR domain-containing protein [Acetatifactor sp.]